MYRKNKLFIFILIKINIEIYINLETKITKKNIKYVYILQILKHLFFCTMIFFHGLLEFVYNILFP